MVGEVQLECAHAGQSPLWRSDLRKSGRVDRSLPFAADSPGEPVAGQLHAVPGVTGKTHK